MVWRRYTHWCESRGNSRALGSLGSPLWNASFPSGISSSIILCRCSVVHCSSAASLPLDLARWLKTIIFSPSSRPRPAHPNGDVASFPAALCCLPPAHVPFILWRYSKSIGGNLCLSYSGVFGSLCFVPVYLSRGETIWSWGRNHTPQDRTHFILPALFVCVLCIIVRVGVNWNCGRYIYERKGNKLRASRCKRMQEEPEVQSIGLVLIGKRDKGEKTALQQIMLTSRGDDLHRLFPISERAT